MKKVVFSGWEVGMRKISFTSLLSQKGNLSLKEASSVKNRILNDEKVTLEFENTEMAKLIYDESKKLGVKCYLKE